MIHYKKAAEELFVNEYDEKALRPFLQINWRYLDDEGKLAALQEIEKELAYSLRRRIKTFEIGETRNNENLSFTTSSKIIINQESLNFDSPYEIIRNYFFNHYLEEQSRVLNSDRKNSVFEKEDLQKLEMNYKTSILDKSITCLLPKNDQFYEFQPSRAFAHEYANYAVEQFIYKMVDRFGIDDLVGEFYVQNHSLLQLYNDKSIQDKVLEKINRKAQIIETEEREINKLKVHSPEEVSSLSDDELYITLLPTFGLIHGERVRVAIMDEIVKRELAHYGIKNETKLKNLEVYDLLNIVDTVSSYISSSPYLAMNKLNQDERDMLNLNKYATIGYGFENLVEPKNMLSFKIFEDIKKRIYVAHKNLSGYKPLIENFETIKSNKYEIPVERIVEGYYGVDLQHFTYDLYESLKNNKRFEFKADWQKNEGYFAGFRDHIRDHVNQVHITKWSQLSEDDVDNFLIELDRLTSQYFKIPMAIVVKSKNLKSTGLFINKTETIYLNEKIYNNPYKILDVYFHEKRHQLQFCLNENKISREQLGLSLEEERLLNINMYNNSKLKITNYIRDPLYKYASQPMETDAFDWGHNITFQIARELERDYGLDPQIKMYLFNLAENCPYLFLNDARRDEYFQDIMVDWKNNENYVDKVNFVLRDKNSELHRLSTIEQENLYEFFNENIWADLDLFDRMRVLKELETRESVNENREQIDDQTINRLVANTFRGNSLSTIEEYYRKSFFEKLKTEAKKMEAQNLSKNPTYKQIETILVNHSSKKNVLYRETHESNSVFYNYMQERIKRFLPYTTSDILQLADSKDYLKWEQMIKKYDFENLNESANKLLAIQAKNKGGISNTSRKKG